MTRRALSSPTLLIVLAGALAAACGSSDSTEAVLTTTPGGGGQDAAATEGGSTGGASGGTGGVDAGNGGTGGASGGTGGVDAGTDATTSGDAGACHVVVNEVQTAGAATDAGASARNEWAELHNPCQASVVLTGWSLKFRAANNNNGGADTDLATLSGSIPAGGYQLYAGSAYPGTKDGDLLSALAGLGGAVGLRDASNALVDSVAYANLTVANPFTETAPAPNPPAGESIARKPNGSDTGNNSTDFQVVTLPTPRAAN